MKEVLVIDAPLMFRQFIKEKLSAEKVHVEFGECRRDGFTKMLSIIPDLIIVDQNDDYEELIDLLTRKQSNPNTMKVPVIVSGPIQERENVSVLAKYGVVKYFSKPIKFDVLFEAISRVLKVPIPLDSTPCILDCHINSNIIFVEIAQGLNREKMALLKFKLAEIIDKNDVEDPKVVVMMTDLDLSFVDGSNLELLLDNILADRRIVNKNVKILSLNNFIKDLIEGHPQYAGIEVVDNLSRVLGSVVDKISISNVADTITSNILQEGKGADKGSVEMRFASETNSNNDGSEGALMRVALVDDDKMVLAMLKNEFLKSGAQVTAYTNGPDFLATLNSDKYDVIILDIYMPQMTGFDVLKRMNAKGVFTPVIIYSQMMQKEMIVQALGLGAKSYILKQQKPDAVVQKAMEVING